MNVEYCDLEFSLSSYAAAKVCPDCCVDRAGHSFVLPPVQRPRTHQRERHEVGSVWTVKELKVYPDKLS